MRSVRCQRKTTVVNTGAAGDNDSMNLFLALFWLVCAAVLLAYEHFIGGGRFRIRIGGESFSAAWLMLVLAVYNMVRWWSSRAHREEQRKLEIARAEREWRQRHRPATPSGPPDPNFNFSDEPPPQPNRGITDQPPSNN